MNNSNCKQSEGGEKCKSKKRQSLIKKPIFVWMILSLFFLIGCSFTQCKSTLFNKNNTWNNSVWKQVDGHLKEGTVKDLIEDYRTIADYRDTISRYLNDITYTELAYLQVEQYRDISNDIDELYNFFDSIVQERQNETLIVLLGLSEPELGNYYKNHCDSLPFMKSYLKQTLVDELPNGSYFYTKQIRGCFESTDLYPEIDSIYQFQREVVLEIIMEELNEYFSYEDQLVEEYKKYASAIVDEYLYKKSDNIAETCRNKYDKGFFKKLFDHEKGDFQGLEKFAKEQYDQKMNIDTTAIISSSCINEYLEKSEMSKQDFLEQHFLDGISCSYSTLAPTISKNDLKNYSAPMSDIQAIKKRQKEDWAISTSTFIASVAAGYSVGGPAGVIIGAAIDVPDLICGIIRGNRNARLDAASFDDFKTRLYNSTKRVADDFVNRQFDELASQNKSRQEIFRYMICENL